MTGALSGCRHVGRPVRHLAPWTLWGVSMLVAAACSTASSPSLPAVVAPTVAASSPSRPTIATSPLPSALGSIVSLPSTGRILFVNEAAGENHPAYLDNNGLHEIPTVLDATLAKAAWASADSIIFDSERDVRRHIDRKSVV